MKSRQLEVVDPGEETQKASECPGRHSARPADISFIKRLSAAPLIMHEPIMQF